MRIGRQVLSRPRPNPPPLAGEGRVGASAGEGRLAIACFVLLFAIAASISPARAQQFGAESFTLANGLQVVVLPNQRAPAITHMVWHKIGAADAPPGKPGPANCPQHLVVRRPA